jgi:hypothetical protein
MESVLDYLGRDRDRIDLVCQTAQGTAGFSLPLKGIKPILLCADGIAITL